MKRRTTSEALQQTVYDLSTGRPHEPPGRRFMPPEYRPYWEGYYFALQTALEAMTATIERERVNRRERRDAKRRREVA